MRTVIRGDRTDSTFHQMVDDAVSQVEEKLVHQIDLQVDVFEFDGPLLASVRGTYSPLDLLRLGLSEKLERGINFLLVVIEDDLTASNRPFALALPSQLTNIGVISTKRLSPQFWGQDDDPQVTRRRLAALMLHTIGHLFNLEHREKPENIMYKFQNVQQIDVMQELDADQIAKMRDELPIEAHEEVAREGQVRFAIYHTVANLRVIWQAVISANPFYLVLQLPTMLTAAFSVIVVLFFTAEVWDVASVLNFAPLIVFSLLAIASSTAVLYRAFKIGPIYGRGGLSEATVVSVGATILTLLLVVLLMYGLFFVLSVISALTLFPEQLKSTWPTAGAIDTWLQHAKLGMFLATMGVLTGSLGGNADSKPVIQQVLFLDEET